MTKLIWKPEYRVGVRQLDQHHKELFDIMNEISNENMQHDIKECSNILNKLVKFSELHFKFEEELLEKIDYPELDLQKREHTKFLEKVFELNRKLVEEQDENTWMEINLFLKNWFISHVLSDDKEYQAFL